MSTPEDTSQGHDEEVIPDLEVSDEDAMRQVKGGDIYMSNPKGSDTTTWLSGPLKPSPPQK